MSKPIKLEPIELVIPDAGPLISLAKANALDLLLVFKDEVRVIVTDYVQFEVTRAAGIHRDALYLQQFFETNNQRIEIANTDIGDLYIERYKRYQKYKSDEAYRETLERLGEIPPKVPGDLGEASILTFVGSIQAGGPSTPTLILAEDSTLLSRGIGFPNNAAIMSTFSFLKLLEHEHLLTSVSDIWSAISEQRFVQETRVNLQAQNIPTDVSASIDQEKVREFDKKWKMKM